MRFTVFTDFAFRILILLAIEPDQRITIRNIAERYGISRNHLMKIVNVLTREEIVSATRGPKGGLRLARPADRITVGEIVRVTEEDMQLVECFGPDDQCVISPACRLKDVLGQSLTAFLNVLDGYSLADLVGNKRDLKKLL